MNMKKTLVTVMATAVAAVSVSAAAVSAVSLGDSTTGGNFTVTDGQGAVATATVTVRGDSAINVTATLPAGALLDGEYSFNASTVADEDEVQKFLASQPEGSVDYCDVVDLSFTTPDGTEVKANNVTLQFAFADGATYDALFVKEGDTYTNLNATLDGTTLTGEAPHCSRFVLAKLAANTDNGNTDNGNTNTDNGNTNTDNGNTNTDNGNTNTNTNTNTNNGNGYVGTGDNANTTAIVFAVMSVVALGTAFTASKLKKASK